MATTTHFNLGTERRPFAVEIAVNPFFDLLMAVWTTGESHDKPMSYEIGSDWLEAFASACPADAREQIEGFAGAASHLALWLLLGMVADQGTELSTIDETLEWIRTSDIRRELVAQTCCTSPESDVDAALDGDEEAQQRVIDECLRASAANEGAFSGKAPLAAEDLVRGVDPMAGALLADALSAIRQAAFVDNEEEWALALERSAESVSLLIPGSRPAGLIERITNGIDFQLPIGITRIVLVPSVVIRPWSMVNETGSTVVIVYPVAEEHLHADPDAAPSWLVSYYKALGDARRLKILRRLSSGPADLSELTELIGMAKTSTFHHIGVLRSAGLVRVHVGGPNAGTYDLRTQALLDADGLLNKYLALEGTDQ
jgi:DNA-binding transcriptional ArsR family regulator